MRTLAITKPSVCPAAEARTPVTQTAPAISTAGMLFMAACLFGAVQLIHPVGYGFGQGYEMAAIARNLAARGTFGNPFEPAITGPTAVVPPLYPAFLAVMFRLFPAPLSLLLPTLGNVLANALTAALMPRLSRLFYGDPAPGVYAGILWLFAMRLMPEWDPGYTLAALVLFAVLTGESFARAEPSATSAIAQGLAAGLVSLANPATVLVSAPWMLFLLARQRCPMKKAARYLTLFVLMPVVCNSPWMIRNDRIWHAFVLRTNFGMTIYSSNNDCAEPSFIDDTRNGCYERNHPVASVPEIALLKRLGEVEYDRERTATAIVWIRSHPARFGQLTLARAVEFWFPSPESPTYTAYGFWLITALSVPGIIFMLKNRVPAVWFVLALWTVYPLVYYVVVSADRYRYPIIWSSLMPAGYALALFCRTRLERAA